jgi:signal transduction histidine kinase/CheY-like chemotaxis protein
VYEKEYRKKDGTVFPVELRTFLTRNDSGEKEGMWAIVRDITERKREAAARERLMAQFQQAQRMESVGRLAGGVAHDYNNMLSVILGFTELAMGKVDPAQPVHANLSEVLKAARRAKEITRQLLVFARSQTIAPKVLDLNRTIGSMLNMLQRLIGEDIDLAWLPETGVWPVKIDPSQIDQILANLCVNARDAISDVGKITIETKNIAFDEDYCADHPEFAPGEYVLMAVSDDGCGMDKETRDQIFEPFFTTKGKGQGTGLGLATVYGIVKQNDGVITVYSEPEKETTFRIYLRRHTGKVPEGTEKSTPEIPLGRGETVLLVEDEESILKMSRTMLEKLGYTVLTAKAPDEAVHLAAEHTEEIHLLMTDVVMPGMNGKVLSERIQTMRPAIKCLFMSGYTADVIAHRGVLDEGVRFIQKPFSIRDVAAKVRAVFDGTG